MFCGVKLIFPEAERSGGDSFDIKSCTFVEILEVMKGRVKAIAQGGGLSMLKERIADLS